MYAVGGSQAIARDLNNLLFSPAFKEYMSTPDLKSTIPNKLISEQNDNYIPNKVVSEQNYFPAGSSLARYRSAPSSLFVSLMEGSGGGTGGGFEDLLLNGTGGDETAESYDLEFAAVKEENIVVQDHQRNRYSSGTYGTGSVVPDPEGTIMDQKTNVLARQGSSPAGFFSNLGVENGFAVLNEAGNYRTSGNGINGKSSPTKRLNDHMNFSSGKSIYMPRIPENGNERSNIEDGHLRNGNSNNNGFYLPTFQNDSWNDSSSLGGLKRSREGEDKFSGFNPMDRQNGNDRDYPSRLTHHVSLPKTTGEIAAIEKFLQFQQDAVPCKIRAKRGCATHPRSIAERMRRTRISDRMKKLQDLFPNMDKQTNTADMLDLAVEYIKDLQTQVQTLTDKKAKCKCSK